MHVGQRLAQLLKDYGVTHVFGVPGGQTLPLYDGLLETDGIAHVLMHDERSAGFAADAYARMTGRTGVCDATVGPGATNLPSAVAEAYCSSIPMVAIIADIPRRWEHRRARGNASQGLRQNEIFASISKWQVTLNDPSALPETVAAAFRVANTGRPGPVVLTIPDDVFSSSVPDPEDTVQVARSSPWIRTAPDPADVKAAAGLIARSSRPALLVGGGVLLSGACAEVQALAELLGAPVATTLSGKGAIAENHPLALGVAGSMGRPVANEILKEADLILFIGTKAGQVATLGWEIPAPGIPSIHVDIDPEEIGRNFRDSLPLAGDAALALSDLLTVLREQGPVSTEWDSEQVRSRVSEWCEAAMDRRQTGTEPLMPQRVMGILREYVNPADVAVCDASLASGWAGLFYPVTQAGRRFLAPRGLAGLGWGAPAAIGAAVAARMMGKIGHVYHFAGDGGLAYSIQELEVMARLHLPVITVVFNNSTLAWVKHSQKHRFDQRYTSVDYGDVDYAMVARGFGVQARRVNTEAELQEALLAARQTMAPMLIDAVTDQWETPVVKFSSAAASHAHVEGEGL